MMSRIVLWLLLAPGMAQAQIYRCETPQGPVFSDERCGEDAHVVTVDDESAGLGGGPSEEVREYLDQKRQERAGQRAEKPPFRPRQPAPDAMLLERIRELEQQRQQYVAVPGSAAELARLERQIAEMKAARNAPQQPSQPQVLRLQRDR